jgi:hypothetical protein
MRQRTGLLGLIWVMCLLLAVLQAAFFVPLVAEGRSLDFGPYRVDGLGLIFALGWTLAVALSAPALAARLSAARTGYLLLLWLALLNMAYAREPWLFYLAWEVAALSLWPALRANGTGSLRWAAAAVHLAGVPFAAALLLGLIQPFAPPAGGEATAWPLPVMLVLGAAAYIRSGAWPFDGWVRAALPRA